ncbi:Putative deoxyribonuclease TATDN1 [Frankliniella fusca]|uniref:Deoxyribonuclease TATDN1 n=1 Tax=Frankliniella fusca TaxID=407009 RepID=A0AAE1LJQ7_9NEOP|nr:Putative deoxyribonuclease TATDN1 [Frankliniella fusca]
MSSSLKFIDIGANLTDPMYQGVYHESKKHAPDLCDVFTRAWNQGLTKIMITGGSLEDSKKALDLAKTNDKLYSTVGCHPTRSLEFEENSDPDMYLKGLEDLCINNEEKVVAFGEFGLDYDRIKFAPKDVQIRYFKEQLKLNEKLRLPYSLIEECGGVVHSFDGTAEDVKVITELGLHIGINGCSLKTEENLQVVKTIPIESLMIETDCPWCEVRPRHAGYPLIKTQFPCVKKEKWQNGSMVKSRNEPANIIQVLEIISSLKGEDVTKLSKQIYQNTMSVFFKSEKVEF